MSASTRRVSVVVPIYNVERYLTDCLESLAQQTHRDLEVVMVDDGSTDSSAALARAFAERDDRFRLVQQPNGGLGNARNTGADHATGDYLTFVDSDDVVVRNAYELLVGSLEDTGSDFASGNYHRLTSTGTWQSAMVAGAFTATRLKTHVSKHPALLNDRTAWNKVFRRSFWDEHRFRWPEGVLYEDIPVTLPAHVLARAVDVLRQPIYLWRARVGDSSSITQRRTEARAIRDRIRAVDGVSRFLAEHDQRSLKKQYDRSVAEQDLRYFLAPLDAADDEFRALFLDLVNDYFDRADPDVFDDLPAIHRLEWHLVRRRLLPELLEVLRFEKSGEINWTPVVRKGRRFWGDYPFRGDPDLAIPDSVYRLDRDELPLRASIEDVSWEGDRLRLTGYAHIAFLDLSKQGSARIRLTLEESGHPENVVAMDVRTVRRPDVTEASPDGVTCYDWCGFEATTPVSALRHRGRFRDGHWRLRVEVRSHGILRRRWLARTEPGRAKRPPLLMADGARVVPTSEVGDFAVQISTKAAEITDVRLDGTVLELHGMLHGRAFDPAEASLRVAREDGTAALHYPAATGGGPAPEGSPVTARVPLEDLLTRHGVGDDVAGVEDRGDGIGWEVGLQPAGDGPRVPLVAAPDLPPLRLGAGAAEVVVRQTRTGRLRVVERHVRPEVDRVRWVEDGCLEVEGRYDEPTGAPLELVLHEANRLDAWSVPVDREGDRFRVRLRPGAMPTPAGDLPLPEGQWDLHARSAGSGPLLRVKIDRALLDSLPVSTELGSRTVRVVDEDFDSLAVLTSSDLPMSQVGRGGRARLQTRDYPAYLRLPRRDQVLVDAYGSGHFGGDARAVHRELARRDGDLDVLWSVVDGQAVLPEGVTAVPRYGRAWHEALARSRYVVAGDYRGVHELAKAAHQRVLQTWHGVPVRRLGLDDPRAGSRLGLGWETRLRRETAQWDVLLSSGPAASAVLRRAFDPAGVVLESGLPRHDLLVSGDRAEVAARVRAALGIPEGRRVVLYAPTYRADQPYRRTQRYGLDRYRFEIGVDLEAVRAVLGTDHVLLVRPHPKSVDTVPEADGTTVADASRWPDLGELLLAADVVVTDCSSVLLDAAVASRPVVVSGPAPGGHLPDGYLDPSSLPWPVVAGLEEALTAAVAVTGWVGSGGSTGSTSDRADGEEAVRALVAHWCPTADGGAAARAVDALLEG